MTTGKLFYRIVMPTDFSDSSEEAGGGLAQRVAGTLGSEVVLAHVFVPPPLYGAPPFSVDTTWQVYESSRKWVEEELEKWANTARAQGVKVRTIMRSGTAHQDR